MEFTESIREQLVSALAGNTNPVELLFYTGEEEHPEIADIRSMLSNIAEILPIVSLKEFKTEDGLSRYPAIKITEPGAKSSYVYYGLPGGYEFSSLVEAIRTTASGTVDIEAGLAEKIKGITKPIHLEIFVTPTCSYCPSMVIAAYRLSKINPLITTEIVESTSFRPYARGKGVMGVPKTLINDGAESIEGSVPIDEFINKLTSL